MNTQRHVIENESKVPTLAGLLIEGFSNIIALFVAIVVFLIIQTGVIEDLTESWQGMQEPLLIRLIVRVYQTGMFFVLIVTWAIFIINLWLFTSLIRGRYSNIQASKVYTYQLIYGLIILLINPLLGILYCFSGYKGKIATTKPG